MSGGQVAALIFAVLLLLWAGALLFFGIGFVFVHAGMFAILFLLPAAVILGLAGLLFWIAFRRGGSASVMSGRQIAALVIAFLLLPPAGAGLLVGGIFTRSHFDYVLLPLALGILGLALVLLFIVHRKHPQTDGQTGS